ncbi:MAG: hypothetical protein HZA08_06450 [Nitrospirae bacterium]|nr:hypothetical protein [Nitrospirota bacterium]
MVAKLVHREKNVLEDGSIVEMVIWELPAKSPERQHGIKYRLYYGTVNGTCIVRYDNETGKGDHRHYRTIEEAYRFVDVETLMADFLADVTKARREIL